MHLIEIVHNKHNEHHCKRIFDEKAAKPSDWIGWDGRKVFLLHFTMIEIGRNSSTGTKYVFFFSE